MTKTDFRKCRYEKCPYNHEINLLKDDYKIIGKTQYYHADCYKRRKAANGKTKKQRVICSILKISGLCTSTGQ